MAKQVWIDPNNSRNRVQVDSRAAPTVSPAPAGNPTVPAGYIKQLGWDGFMDTGGIYVNGVAMPNITIPGVPYFTGVLFPVVGFDPNAGQPYHTASNIGRKDGVND